jgi:N-methylhydantoinase B
MSASPAALRPATDPLTLEVIKNALSSVADEMALMLMRSAYSPVVRDTMDYSTALCMATSSHRD